MEQLIKNFIESGSERDALLILAECRSKELWNMGVTFGSLFETVFSSPELLDEFGICLYYNQQYKKSHSVYQKIYKMGQLTHTTLKHYLYNDHFNYSYLQHDHSTYNPSLVRKIMNTEKPLFPLITFSITSCKRFNLFSRTMNSFIACCEDRHLISEWICIDDNSSEEDRREMERLYPFFTFVLKTDKEKGHVRSMNKIQKIVKTPYLCHIEDDWEFFIPRPYLTDALSVLNSSKEIVQCLFNQNYGEIAQDINISGGLFNTSNNGTLFYIHDHCSNDEFIAKYGNVLNCAYWPHFSFRPSLIKTTIYKDLGEFSEIASHFEMEYANRYFKKGFRSAFFAGIHTIHIGRLTSDRFDKSKENAYTLNNEEQFSKKEFDAPLVPEWLTPELHDNLLNVSPENKEVIEELKRNGLEVKFGVDNEMSFIRTGLVATSEPPEVDVQVYSAQLIGWLVNLDTRKDRLDRVLQQLEKSELVQTVVPKGRKMSPKGRKLLQEVADDLHKELVKTAPELSKYRGE